MRRHLLRLTGFSAGYLAVVLLERIVRRLEAQQAEEWRRFEAGEAHVLTMYPGGAVRARCSCSQHRGMTRRAGLACEGAA